MRTAFSTAVGRRIEAARRAKNMNQTEVAVLLPGNADQTILSKWENGERTPSARSLTALAPILGVTTDYLLCLSDDMQPPAVRRRRATVAPNGQLWAPAASRDSARTLGAVKRTIDRSIQRAAKAQRTDYGGA